MQRDKKHIKQLESTIKKFMAPLEDIPFPIAIKVISGYEIIAFDRSSAEDKALLSEGKI